ncbi:hypothetical protein ERJ75_001772100 [Trypanosoma vivax]|nr:hypothetical protein ERJ75_001772100 [Trypanosoma vivax]
MHGPSSGGRKEAEKAAEFCADVEREARRLRDASRDHSKAQAHGRGNRRHDRHACHTQSRQEQPKRRGVHRRRQAAAASELSQHCRLQAERAESMLHHSAGKWTPRPLNGTRETCPALTLFDGSGDTNAVVADPEERRVLRVFHWERHSNAVLYSTGWATPTWPRHGEACGRSPKLGRTKRQAPRHRET